VSIQYKLYKKGITSFMECVNIATFSLAAQSTYTSTLY